MSWRRCLRSLRSRKRQKKSRTTTTVYFKTQPFAHITCLSTHNWTLLHSLLMTLTFFFPCNNHSSFNVAHQFTSFAHFAFLTSFLIFLGLKRGGKTWVCVTSRGELSGSSALCFQRCPFSHRFNGKCSSSNSGRESSSLAIDLCYNQTPTFRFADHSGEKKEESRGFVMLRVANRKRHITTRHTGNILLRRGCFVDGSHCRQAQIERLCVHYSRWRAAPQVFLGGLVSALDTSQQRYMNMRVYKSSKRLGWK